MALSASRARRRRRRRLRSLTIDKFEYLPVDSSRREIRLLTIAPGPWKQLGDTLRCTIHHAFLPAAIDEDNLSESGEDDPGNDSVEQDTMSDTSDEEDGISNNSLEELPLSSQSGEDTLSKNSNKGHMLNQMSGTYFNATSPSKQQVDHTSTSDTDEEPGYGSRPEEPEYETISYAWGDAAQRDFIFLNGLLFDLPRSSEQALRRVRLGDRSRTVWIDAVCIDQSNTEERSQQVAIMADIYRHGQQNLIYLGNAPESTQAALDGIQLLMETEIADVTKDGDTLMDVIWDSAGAFRYDTTGLTVTIDEDALAEFYSRPWFSRLWVLQEVALAKHNVCICGPFDIDLESALMVATWLKFKLVDLLASHSNTAADMLDHIDSPYSVYQRGTFEVDLLNLLNDNAQDSMCTDPRDKVYAILGLIKWSEHGGLPEELTPDYSRSIADVLGLAGSWAIRSNAWCVTERLLMNVSHRSDGDIHLDGLPSWIPHWHRPWSGREDVSRFRATQENELICMTDEACEVASWETPLGLHFRWSVQGIFLGVIEAVYTRISGEFVWGDWGNLPRSYITPLRGLLVAYGGDEEVNAALWKILTASTWADSAPLRSRHIDMLRTWGDETTSQKPPFSRRTEYDRECGQAVLQACLNRVIAKLEGGCPVLAPLITVPGDIMVWISGSDYPTVLRPCGKEYQVIGQAYVYDVLSHEAVVAWQKEKKGLQTFVLV